MARLAVNGAALGLDDGGLGAGWHDVESDVHGAEWRWTDGDATIVLPRAQLGDITILVGLAFRLTYWFDIALIDAQSKHVRRTGPR